MLHRLLRYWGAGVTVDRRDVLKGNVSALANAIEQVIGNPRYREAAKKLSLRLLVHKDVPVSKVRRRLARTTRLNYDRTLHVLLSSCWKGLSVLFSFVTIARHRWVRWSSRHCCRLLTWSTWLWQLGVMSCSLLRRR
jgi:hypothetical protein